VISIGIAASADDDLCAAVAHLLPQVSSSPPPTLEQLRQIVDDPGTALFVAYDEDRLVGTLTLAAFRAPSGVRAWIEDVVVDDSARRNGVASALVEAALARAAEMGARTVDLTSRPEREAANRLYLRLGFEQRRTNVYRRTLGG
jgi:ribosomal protein S18 acetylase RimI-like enzyme